MMQLNTVVLPAPFGPMMLWMLRSRDIEVKAADGGEPAEAHRQLRLQDRSRLASSLARAGSGIGPGASPRSPRRRRAARGGASRMATAPRACSRIMTISTAP